MPAYANLADLMRQQGRDSEGERVLTEGLARVPDSAELHHSYGLLLVRQHAIRTGRGGARPRLRRSPLTTRATPMSTLWPCRKPASPARRVAVLEQAVRRHPADPDLLFTLAAALPAAR